MWTGVPKTIFPNRKQALPLEMVMEELHRIHKDVPFGYWVDGVVPLYRWLTRRWAERRAARAATACQPATR